MQQTTFDTKTVNGLMGMFYHSATTSGRVGTFDYVDNPHFDHQFALTAKQFSWLCDVERRECGMVPRGRAGREVTGEIDGVGFFTAHEQMHGSAIVNVRLHRAPGAQEQPQ